MEAGGQEKALQVIGEEARSGLEGESQGAREGHGVLRGHSSRLSFEDWGIHMHLSEGEGGLGKRDQSDSSFARKITAG